jgi:hypothetical protein
MQYVDGVGEPNRLNSPEGVAVVIDDGLEHTGPAESVKWFDRRMRASLLSLVEHETNLAADRLGERLKILTACSDPVNPFHGAIISLSERFDYSVSPSARKTETSIRVPSPALWAR